MLTSLALVFIGGTGLISVLINLLVVLLILGLIYYIVTLLPLPPVFLRIAQIVFAIIVILYLASLLTGCAQQPNAAPNAVTRTGQDLKAVVTTALQDYAQAKTGGVNSLWSISKGLYAYSAVVKTTADVKQVIADWKSTAGDNILNRIERVLNMSDAPAETKALIVAAAAQDVAASASP